jgi:hypothetical protein
VSKRIIEIKMAQPKRDAEEGSVCFGRSCNLMAVGATNATARGSSMAPNRYAKRLPHSAAGRALKLL